MSKLYKCAKGCGSIEENDKEKVPTCCGVEMIEINEEELFSCPGCSGCHTGCHGEEVK
ncbi:MAG: hypothetical protein P1P85_05160 [Patescibacteria group bacterium]|nr:hypothetical protein [Patescibacteria group bacterium]